MPELAVFVVDDDQTVREALTFLMRHNGMTCRSFSSATDFLDQLQPHHAGCVITDIRMPEMSGIDLVDRLRERNCAIPVVVITGHADVPLAVQAMKAGVQDFIEKPFKSETILKAVRQCLNLARSAQAKETRRTAITQRLALLTERERQILAGIVRGSSNKELGLELGISRRTVDIHRANVMHKMQAESLAELVRMVSRAAPDDL